MNLLYIITQADGGGAQKYTLALANYFKGSIAAGNEAVKLFEEAKKSDLTTFPLYHLKRNINPFHDFLAVWEIRELLKILKPDIVHLNSTKAGVLGSFATIGLKTKVVFTAHGFIFNEPLSPAIRSFYLAAEKTASSYRDYIITVSDADKKSALENNLISESKISTIHNGIEVINFLPKEEAKTKLNLPKNKFIIGCVANAYKTKGLDVLIEAISILSDDLKKLCEFIIIGDGPEFTNLKLKIENLHLTATINLAGKIDNVNTLLRAFDLFLLPSRKEGLPYTLLEAMQAGLPIIATNVGGNKEALGDSAILIKPEDPQILAKTIANLLNNPQLQKELSVKTLKQSELFTENRMLEETQNIYKKLLS